MATVSQSGVYNLQSLTSVGALGVGMRIYTYTAGTTTHKTAYTDSAGAVAHTYTSDGSGGQYIAMDARGELPAPLYLTSGAYDLALKTAAGATVWTRRADPVGADLAASTGSNLIGFLQSGGVARTVQDDLRETFKVSQFGAVGDGVTVDTAAMQKAINAANGKTLLIDGTFLIDGPLDFTGWTGNVIGGGTIKCKAATTISVALNFVGAINVNWQGVSLDMGQTIGTLTGGARSDSGFYIKDCRDCFFSSLRIVNCKFGEPIYVDGTSSVSPSASHGSKRIHFTDIDCIAISAATVDDGAFVNVRSDFYTGGGLYAASSNGCKNSDYTLDAAVAYQRTTEEIYFTNCNFENLDRFALYNVKNVHMANVSLVNNYTRGLSMSPSCEKVTWIGGKVSGNAAHINANYACSDILISGLIALGETAVVGQRHCLRVGFGTQRVKFCDIVGLGCDTRQVFIEGAKDVTFDNVSLKNWGGGNTTVAASIAGGGAANTSSWVTSNIKFLGCDFSANYAFRFDDNAGTATVADGAVLCDEATLFNLGLGFFNGAAPSNKLTYYGSGALALTLAGASVAGAHSFTASGKYRRLGDLVYVEGTIALTAKDAAMAGAVQIAGLPFKCEAGTDNNGTLAVGYWTGLTFPANYTAFGLLMPPGVARATLWRFGSAQTAAQVQPAEIGATAGITFSGCYLTDE